VIFFRQKFITPFPWNPRRRDLSGNAEREDIELFKEWLEDNYPNIDISIDRRTRVGYSRFISGLFLQLLVSVVLGITRYKVGIPSHACWLLIWIYGGPSLGWMWLITMSMDKEPCLSPFKWCLYELVWLLAVIIAVGVYGGITVISVELLGAFCEETISLPPQIWIGVGAAIAFVLLVVPCTVIFYSNLFGKLINSPILTPRVGETVISVRKERHQDESFSYERHYPQRLRAVTGMT
jgi:hypothetical protein